MVSTADLLQTAFRRHKAGDLQQAESLYRQVLRVDPDQSDALQLLGTAAYQQGRHEVAEKCLRRAVALRPENPACRSNLGATLRALGRPEEAVECYRRALDRAPHSAEIHCNLGNVLKDLKHFEEAVAAYRKAVRLNSRCAEAFNNMAEAFKQLQRIDEAFTACRRALAIDPRIPEGHFNLGNLLRSRDRLDEAISSYRRAITLRPGYKDALINLGYSLEDLGRHAEAIACYERAIEIDPDCAEARFNRSLALLRRMDFLRGWDEYRWRWPCRGESPPELHVPQCRGAIPAGQRILVTPEQGIGDEVMFASCLPDLIDRATEVAFACSGRLASLFARSFPTATVIPWQGADFLPADIRERIDLHLPLADLPSFFRTDLQSFPRHNGYLIPDQQSVDRWRKRYAALGPGLTIGISWRGGRDSTVRRRRSTTLSQWSRLLAVENVRFVNLQYGDSTAERHAAARETGIEIHDWPEGDPLKNLDDFAARVAALDLVISVDNATVHLAGALGVPVWILLPFAADWRWFEFAQHTPWYPGARLLRQVRSGDWDELFARTAAELAAHSMHQGTVCAVQRS